MPFVRCAPGALVFISALSFVLGLRDVGDAHAAETAAALVDVTEGRTYDGWGRAAVDTLSMYYGDDGTKSDVAMLGYRSSFLPVFDCPRRRRKGGRRS